jgi:hypothetical protein
MSGLVQDFQESGRAIDSVALRIANASYDPRTFQSFDGALRGRKRDRQFVSDAFCSDERICTQEFDHTQRRMRHTVGTMLAEMGEHQLTIRDYLQRSNLHVTNKYLQATSKTKRSVQEKLVEAFVPAAQFLPKPTLVR